MVQRLCCSRLIQGQPHCNLCHPMNHQNRFQWRDKCFLLNCCSMCMLSLVCALSKSETWISPSGDGGLDYFSLPSHNRTQKAMKELTKPGSLLTTRTRSPPAHESSLTCSCWAGPGCSLHRPSQGHSSPLGTYWWHPRTGALLQMARVTV